MAARAAFRSSSGTRSDAANFREMEASPQGVMTAVIEVYSSAPSPYAGRSVGRWKGVADVALQGGDDE